MLAVAEWIEEWRGYARIAGLLIGGAIGAYALARERKKSANPEPTAPPPTAPGQAPGGGAAQPPPNTSA